MPIVDAHSVGPIRYQIEARAGFLALFSAADQRRAILTALRAGGALWLQVFLPKRFSDYAQTLGYSVNSKWKEYKERVLGQALPFVGFTPSGGGAANPKYPQSNLNGEKMVVAAMTKSNTDAGKVGGQYAILIRVPYGHAIRPEFAEMFTTVPKTEINRIAFEVARVLTALLSSGRPTELKGTTAWRTLAGAQSRIPDRTTPRRAG